MKTIKVAIIGMGRMGACRYNTMKAHGGYEIVSLCDNNDKRLEGYSEKKYTNWKECIDAEELDAIVVCTYNAFIPQIVCYALDKGLAVFSEKPPGRNLEDALSMKESYDKANKPILKFGFNHRYHYSVIEARALVDSGILGEVVCARGVYGKAGNPRFSEEWRNQTDISGGGILLDQGIHMLDLMYYFLGEFTNIQSSVDQLVWRELETEDSAFSILKTANGKVASLHSSAIQWRHKFSLDLILTKGFISLNGLFTSTNSYGEEQITYYYKDLDEKTGKLGRPMEHTLCFDHDDSWMLEMSEFYKMVMEGTDAVQGSIYDAVYLMKMISEIYMKRN